MLQVSIQGVAGCFHDAAAREFFSASGQEIELVEHNTFPELFDYISKEPERLGVVAIENTIAGSILPNYELLDKSGVKIIGEHHKRISHVLCALPGETLKTIREVNSHPMALMQCSKWLSGHPHMKIVEHYDTAGSARDIAKGQLTGHAAVCSEFAAKLYGLEILAYGIETDKHNFTRFLIVKNGGDGTEGIGITNGVSGVSLNKASVMFRLPHTQGALAHVLAILSFYGLNLTKIQSTPVIGKEWEYNFHIDLTFESLQRFEQAIAAVKPLLIEFKLLGKYNNTLDPMNSEL